MTHYMGSKARYAADILKHVLADRRPGQWYVEPFVGGGNVLCRVPPEQGPRLAADYNPFMVTLLKRLSEGWEPPETLTKETYEAYRARYRKNPQSLLSLPDDEIAFIAAMATGASFGSKWFDIWVGDCNKNAQLYWNGSRKGCLRDAQGLQGAWFVCSSFNNLLNHAATAGHAIPPHSIFYCDPPYSETESYGGAQQHIAVGDSASKNEWKPHKFWRWCDALHESGHRVFVSEYSRPAASIYSDISDTDKVRATRARAGTLQREIIAAEKQNAEPCNADGTPNYFHEPIDTAAWRVELDRCNEILRRHDEVSRQEREARAARWKVVWQRDVKVILNNTETAVTGDARGRTELLLTRID